MYIKNCKGLITSIFGWRVSNSGGNLNNGANAGVAYLNANNDSDNSNSNISAQLSFTTAQVIEPCLLAKNINDNMVLVAETRKFL